MSTVWSLLRAWRTLPGPDLDDVVGTARAEMVRPLRHVAPWGLGLVGLSRWHGKRFVRDGDDGDAAAGLAGVNLVRTADGRPVVAVTYAADAPRPWRWVRDELRVLDDGTLVGMTYVDRPLLRRLGLPFLLVAERR